MLGNIIYEHGIVTIFNTTLVGEDDTVLYGGNAEYSASDYGGQNLPTDVLLEYFISSSEITMSFSSSYKLFETQYQITLPENEFNYSTNPTIVSGSTVHQNIISGSNIGQSPTASYGKLLDFATGSYFEPYITTVGLYDNDYQLLAVGKLAKPLQTSATTDTTILINIDR
jgi:hypothetical protein